MAVVTHDVLVPLRFIALVGCFFAGLVALYAVVRSRPLPQLFAVLPQATDVDKFGACVCTVPSEGQLDRRIAVPLHTGRS